MAVRKRSSCLKEPFLVLLGKLGQERIRSRVPETAQYWELFLQNYVTCRWNKTYRTREVVWLETKSQEWAEIKTETSLRSVTSFAVWSVGLRIVAACWCEIAKSRTKLIIKESVHANSFRFHISLECLESLLWCVGRYNRCCCDNSGSLCDCNSSFFNCWSVSVTSAAIYWELFLGTYSQGSEGTTYWTWSIIRFEAVSSSASFNTFGRFIGFIHPS